jgi:hypothetical protein
MATAVSRGSYYKLRSRKFLEARGFAVASAHITGWQKTGDGRFVPFTRDIFGADLLAMAPGAFWLVQVKGGASWRDHLAAARRRFSQYPVVAGAVQVVLGWPPQAREPDILVVAIGPQTADHPVETPPRRKPRVLPLFSHG